MIDAEQAKREIYRHQSIGVPIDVSVQESSNLILAQDIYSPITQPVFDNSAMDGFAMQMEDTLSATADKPVCLEIIGDIWAGKKSELKIKQGICVRIMTGSKIPEGATCVIPKENVTAEGDVLWIRRPATYFENIRRSGEEFRAGDLILGFGRRITASIVGLLASVGLSQVRVYPQPRVVIVPTGLELAKPGENLQESQIYESTSYALLAALTHMGIVPEIAPVVTDDRNVLFDVVSRYLKKASHIILCGGVSVGDYDYTKSVLSDCGVHEIFWGVKQKPGKPLYFGSCGSTSVFGLPGNPVSSLICFYEYVRLALLKYRNTFGFHPNQSEENLEEIVARYDLKKNPAILVGSLKKKNDFTHFVRARAYFENQILKVKPLSLQGSHMMKGLADANCLILFPHYVEKLDEGDSVYVHLLPQEELCED